MTQFVHMDHTGDTLQVRPLLLGKQRGLLFEIIPSKGRSTGRACVFVPEAIAREQLGLSQGLQVAGYDTVARAEYSYGELTVVVEGEPGDSPQRVAKALRKLLDGVTSLDISGAQILTELALILDVDEADILDAVRQAKETILAQDQKIGQQITELEVAGGAIRDLARERDKNSAGWSAARARIQQLESGIAADREGVGALRAELKRVGLNGMSTATLPEVVARIKGLGDENNSLRERLSAAGMLTAKDELEQLRIELAEERQIGKTLVERERALRTQVSELQAKLGAETQARLTAENGARIAVNELDLLREGHGNSRRKVEELEGALTIERGRLADVAKRALSLRGLLEAIADVFGRVPEGTSTVMLTRVQAQEIQTMISEALKA